MARYMYFITVFELYNIAVLALAPVLENQREAGLKCNWHEVRGKKTRDALNLQRLARHRPALDADQTQITIRLITFEGHPNVARAPLGLFSHRRKFGEMELKQKDRRQ